MSFVINEKPTFGLALLTNFRNGYWCGWRKGLGRRVDGRQRRRQLRYRVVAAAVVVISLI